MPSAPDALLCTVHLPGGQPCCWMPGGPREAGGQVWQQVHGPGTPNQGCLGHVPQTSHHSAACNAGGHVHIGTGTTAWYGAHRHWWPGHSRHTPATSRHAFACLQVNDTSPLILNMPVSLHLLLVGLATLYATLKPSKLLSCMHLLWACPAFLSNPLPLHSAPDWLWNGPIPQWFLRWKSILSTTLPNGAIYQDGSGNQSALLG